MSEDERPPAPHPLRKPGEAEASPDVLTALSCGDIDLEGRLPWSSNATFLVTVTLGGHAQRAVYRVQDAIERTDSQSDIRSARGAQ